MLHLLMSLQDLETGILFVAESTGMFPPQLTSSLVLP